MTPFLIPEVLREILLHIANPCELSGTYSIEGLRALYPFIFVNRQWCRIAIPILWSQPFLFGKEFDYIPIISMYLKCLENQDIKSLLDQGIDISLMTDYNQMQLGVENKKPMFNYPGFLRVLYYEQMINAIGHWCAELDDIMEQQQPEQEQQQPDCDNYFTDEEDEENNENNVMLFNNAEEIIMKTLLQLCLKYGSRLYGLHINPETLDETNDEMYEILLTDDQLKDLVSPVRSLHIYARVTKIKLYKMLTQRCHKIEHLYLSDLWARHCGKEIVISLGKAITSLISSQNALVSFSLTSCKAYTRVFIPPLKLHSSTLRYIRFDKVDFKGCDPWHSIAECRNIELLEVFQCRNLEEEMVGPVTKARFGKHFEVSNKQCRNVPPPLYIFPKLTTCLVCY
ncbi:E3 ubiquitin-protein ligase RAD18 [Gigaspora margarita]|uniref:E3 ubiquitin-protein ligase RAD18 n=1 Tax=Gigaspora margarita TaxID=4874 RepID=A0A8H4EJ84_GIGMA|nr:E3 ubiquitin-protein ligase RAD18 [Gigaspora margarita]